MPEKLELLCCVPGEIYIDDTMTVWNIKSYLADEVCNRCGKTLTMSDSAFLNSKDHEVVCEDCVREILPVTIFSHYRNYHKVEHLFARFGPMMNDMQEEFLRHVPEKGDSWEDCEMTNLVVPLIKVACKFILADTEEISYEELIDLGNMCLMTGTRYRRELDEDTETT